MLQFVEAGGAARIEVFALDEAQLRFRWLAPMSRDRIGCDGNGEASAIAPPFADPEIEDGPDGEVFAGREYWHATDTGCMLSLVIELEPARWLRVKRLDCTGGRGSVPTATGLFRRSGSADGLEQATPTDSG